jgi:hypothetical protein
MAAAKKETRPPKDYVSRHITLRDCINNGWISLVDVRYDDYNPHWNPTPTFISQDSILRVFLSNLLTLREQFVKYRILQLRHDMKHRPTLAKYVKNGDKMKNFVVGNPYTEQQFAYYFHPPLNIKIDNHKDIFLIDGIRVNPGNTFYTKTPQRTDILSLDLTYGLYRIISIEFPRKYFDMNELPPPTEITYRLVKTNEIIKNHIISIATLSNSESVIKHPLEPSPRRIFKQNPPNEEHSENTNENNNNVYTPPISHSHEAPIELKNIRKNNEIREAEPVVELVAEPVASVKQRGVIPTSRVNVGQTIGNEQLGGFRRTKKQKYRRSKTSKTKYRR